VNPVSEHPRILVPHTLRPFAGSTPVMIVSYFLLAAVLAFGIFAALTPAWSAEEFGAVHWLNSNHAPLLDGAALTLAWLFSPPIAVVISLGIATLIVVTTRNPARAATFLGVIAVGWGGSEVVKLLVQRDRPDIALLSHPLLVDHTFGYPSGHTCFATALSVSLIVLARDHRRVRVFAAVAALAVVIVALSRVYLGVHYPTDVAASVAYAIASSTIALVVWLRYMLPWLASRFPVVAPPAGDATVEDSPAGLDCGQGQWRGQRNGGCGETQPPPRRGRPRIGAADPERSR
jgi:membrane-associated phospholipid phosphatase